MNEYDSELIQTILLGTGLYSFVESEDTADIVLLNTCSVRDNAKRKIYGYIHAIYNKRQDKPLVMGVLGCLASHLREELLKNRNLKIDLIVGPDSYKRLPEILAHTINDGEKGFDVTLSEFETYADVYPSRKQGVNAWIAIMRGCNNFCSFCVVPYARGRERSRGVKNIIEEVQRLANEGFKQVTLLGQNVNSYHSGETDFSDLLRAVSQVKGIERIRFMSPHPKDFPDKLIETMTYYPKISKHIHLPLQAGNNRVLEMMKRNYSKNSFLKLVEKIRQKIPAIVLTTDIIVGFPTETDEEFQDTVDVMNKVEFDSAFIFKYSPRDGTLAVRKYLDDVCANIKTNRIVQLNELQKQISLQKNQSEIGKVCNILIENESTTRSQNEAQGRTDGNKLVILEGKYSCGDMILVRITDATPHVLKGEEFSS